GEGVERLWSHLRKLIGITRSLHGVNSQGEVARKVVTECQIPTEVLREQWADQREAQLSVHAHAPTRLKKELEAVLTLQGQMEAFDTVIQNLRKDLSTNNAPTTLLQLIDKLQKTQDNLKDDAEALYSTLNVHDSFPELWHVDLEFVKILLMARDLKINIRKRAIGSFLEWDKLDRAVGGRKDSLGTKLHQATRSAIASRAPALMNAIKKFNGYCATAASINKDKWKIPTPEPLPLKLAELRESPLLYKDIWITKDITECPLWLTETKICDGIPALLKMDRCSEEQERLTQEAGNLCRWFGRELLALEAAIDLPFKIKTPEPSSSWLSSFKTTVFDDDDDTASLISDNNSDTTNNNGRRTVDNDNDDEKMIDSAVISMSSVSNKGFGANEDDSALIDLIIEAQEIDADQEVKEDARGTDTLVNVIWDLP
ncbi:hypothetical protein C0991_004191, partial [Blastosporella zonata]